MHGNEHKSFPIAQLPEGNKYSSDYNIGISNLVNDSSKQGKDNIPSGKLLAKLDKKVRIDCSLGSSKYIWRLDLIDYKSCQGLGLPEMRSVNIYLECAWNS